MVPAGNRAGPFVAICFRHKSCPRLTKMECLKKMAPRQMLGALIFFRYRGPDNYCRLCRINSNVIILHHGNLNCKNYCAKPPKNVLLYMLFSAIRAKNAAANFSSLAWPTPWTVANSSSEVGRRRAMSVRERSLKTT